MKEEPYFIHDPGEGKRKELYKKLDVYFDVEARARAKFMKNFVIALIMASKEKEL